MEIINDLETGSLSIRR